MRARRSATVCFLSIWLIGLLACSAEQPSGPPLACHQGAERLLIPHRLRARVLLLIDSRFDAPPALPAVAADLRRISETGDIEDGGEPDFIGLIDARVDVREVSFDRPLLELLDELGPADWYERHIGWIVVLASSGDVGPGFYPPVEEMPTYVESIVVVGGAPPDLVPDWYRDRAAVLADPRMTSEDPLCTRGDGVDPLPAPALIDTPGYALRAYLVSLCSEAWDAELMQPIVEQIGGTLATGSCYRLPRVDASPDAIATCSIYEHLAPDSPFHCDDLPGRVPAGMEGDRERCEVIQQRPTADPEPPAPGWFLDEGSYWAERRCGHDRSAAYLRFSSDAYPMPGSAVRLDCLFCTELAPDAGAGDGGR